jgi:hypothetical protein
MRLLAVLLLAAGIPGCLAYEYEHEFWLDVDGSGSVFVTGQPTLWRTFKGLSTPGDDGEALRRDARALFERSGLRVRRVTVTRRQGRPYLFVSADFDDVNRLPGTSAFPDLRLTLRRENGRLRLAGTWSLALPRATPPPVDAGLMAVRFHLPSKVYEHQNAFAGVERGNIVAWRQDVAQGLAGRTLEFGAVMDSRSILHSTVGLFAGAIVLGLGLLGLILAFVFRRGRRLSS